MNEVLKTIEQRFSCRGYDGRPIEHEKLEAMAKAALQAPSAMNIQPWEIIVINDKGLVDELDVAAMEVLEANPDKTGYNRIMERGGKVFYNAPCMFLVLKHSDARWGDMDCGILTQNICLAASSMGVDNVIVGMGAIPFNGPRGEELKKHVNWPEGREFGMGVLVGYGNVSKEPHEVDISKLSFVK